MVTAAPTAEELEGETEAAEGEAAEARGEAAEGETAETEAPAEAEADAESLQRTYRGSRRRRLYLYEGDARDDATRPGWWSAWATRAGSTPGNRHNVGLHGRRPARRPDRARSSAGTKRAVAEVAEGRLGVGGPAAGRWPSR